MCKKYLSHFYTAEPVNLAALKPTSQSSIYVEDECCPSDLAVNTIIPIFKGNYKNQPMCQNGDKTS